MCDSGCQWLPATSQPGDYQAGYWRLTEAPEKPHCLESLGQSTHVDTEMLLSDLAEPWGCCH